MGGIYAFDDFELDGARFELRRSGTPLEVQPKVLRLLLYLVKNRARAVPGEELLRELWPDTTVGAGSVKRAVLAARHALGDHAEERQTIRTVRGLGYQFARDVRELGQSAPATTPESAEPDARTRLDVVSADYATRDLVGADFIDNDFAHNHFVHNDFVHNHFVGRENVMQLLEESLTAALAGNGRCVLLSGPPGIGKTRTAEELWARARARGAHTWLGPSTSIEGAPAYWPLLQVLRDALRDRGATAIRALMGPSAAEIVQALPDLRDVLPDAQSAAPLTARFERFRFFDGVSLLLRRAAELHPIVLGFDDLHHADPATLQLLCFMVRQLVRVPILIVGTFRRELAFAQAPEPLLALAREERTRCIELQGFDRHAIARFVAGATGVEPPAPALDALQEQTAGNPLFVRQLVESWRASPSANGFTELARAGGGLDLQGAIKRHVEVVSETCRDLLRTAAVLGREFSAPVLARVMDRAIEPVWLQLSEAESAQLIEPAARPGRFRFMHALIRDALYRQLPSTERARLHGLSGRALEAQGPGHDHVLWAEITRHFVLAAPLHDGGHARPYTLRAAEQALSRFAYEEAAEHFACALSLLEYGVPDPRERMRLLFRRGDALARTAELATARAALFEALHLARELGDAEILYHAATLIAARPETGAVDPAQLAAVRDALAALPEPDPRRVLLQAALAKSLVYGRNRAERDELAYTALQRGRALPDTKLKIEVLIRCHEALIGPEHLRERVKIAAELLQLARQQGDAAGLLRASATQIETCIECGDMDGVESALTSMEALAEQVREPYFRWHARAVRGTQALIFGQAKRAEQLAREALELGTPLGEDLVRHMYCTQMVTLLCMRGRYGEAEPLAREMTMRHPGVQGWVARLGVIECRLGRREVAQRCLNQIIERQHEWLAHEPFPLSGLVTFADLCAALSDSAAAERLYPALLPYAEHCALTHLGASTYGPVTRSLGILAAVRGDVTLAEQHFRRALKSAQALRSPTFQALVLLAHAHTLLDEGRPERKSHATQLLRDALAHAERSHLDGLVLYGRGLARQYALHALELTPQA